MTKRRSILLFVALLAACGGDLTEDYDFNRAALTGTICPGTTLVYGIDVSSSQGTINWTSVFSSGRKFALIRHSDGTVLDPNRFTNWNNAKAAGLTVGFYQFFRASGDAIVQADNVVASLGTLSGTARPNLPPVIAIETNDGQSNATVIAKVNQWLDRVYARTGRQPVLYTSPGYWNSLGNPNVGTSSHPLPYLWDKDLGVSCPTVPSPWGRLRFWQYGTGTVSGISGAVNLDLYNGSLTEMQNL